LSASLKQQATSWLKYHAPPGLSMDNWEALSTAFEKVDGAYLTDSV